MKRFPLLASFAIVLIGLVAFGTFSGRPVGAARPYEARRSGRS